MKRILLTFSLLIVALSCFSQIKAEDFKQPCELGQKFPSSNFTGDVWLAKINKVDSLNVPLINVTFASGCINSWHYHTGGQLLIAGAGVGYYQEKDKPARRLRSGDIVEVAPGIVHWHGAAPDSWFSHVAVGCNPVTNKTVWLNPVGDEEYQQAVKESVSKYTEANQVLSARQKAIIEIAAYTGHGDLEGLKTALLHGLEAEMTQNEIKEVLIQSYAYNGFPRALRAINTFMELEKDRQAHGINDPEGREASPIKSKRSKYDRGRDILAEISGVPTSDKKNGYATFVPTIERFLKEHLFADIFERDLLSYQERELATVAILAGIGNVEPMAYGHMSISLHLGTTLQQLSVLLDIVEIDLGKSSSDPLRKVLESLTENKTTAI